MKLSTVIIAGMALAGAASAASAATVFEQYNYTYGSDTASVGVTNTDAFGYSDVVINGFDLGALAAGSSVSVNIGDPYEGGAILGVVAITSGHGNGVGAFTLGDFDDPNSHFLGTISLGTPEPASWALMLVGFGGLGMAMRSRRRASLAI